MHTFKMFPMVYLTTGFDKRKRYFSKHLNVRKFRNYRKKFYKTVPITVLVYSSVVIEV